MLNPGPERSLRLTRRFAAAPERVFDAWLDPAKVRLWLFARPGDEAYHSQVEAREGGAWSITTRRGGVDYTATGAYLEIRRPTRLVFTFTLLQFSPNTDTITVEIAPEGAGCVLTLTQQGVDIAAELACLPAGTKGGSELGWAKIFDTLAATLA